MNWESILRRNGFEKLGQISSLDLEISWNPEKRVEIHVLDLGFCVILRGTKTYFVQALSDQGELFVRDLEPMLEWLEVHFPAVRIHCSYFRDISRSLALTRISEKRFRETGADFVPEREEARLARVRAEFERTRSQLHDRQALKQLDAMSSLETPTLTGLLRQQEANLKREAVSLSEEGKRLEKSVGIAHALLEQYQKKASAVCVTFSIATEGTWAPTEPEFRDALAAITKELHDIDRYQIRQKLCYGQLNVPIQESTDPALDWLALWAGGYPNPTKLKQWGDSFDEFRRKIESRFMVTPVRDIVVGGAVKDQKKLVAPRVIRSFLERLPRVPQQPVGGPKSLTEGGWLGFVMDRDTVTDTPILHPHNLRNGYVSGTTTAGKSYTARVIVENSIAFGVIVIVLDPTRQWSALTRAATDEHVLTRLDEFGIGRQHARGFDARVFIPGTRLALPDDLKDLFTTTSVICLKGLEDADRCRIARDVLLALYNYLTTETEKPRVLLVLEEVHSFLPGNVVKGAEPVAKEVSILINRLAREKVKYGGSSLFVTQGLADFRGGARVVREMCNSRFFMRATDRAELDFVDHCISKEAAETVKNLRPGEALVHGSMMPTAKVLVRPPLSEVRELSDHEILSGMSALQGHQSSPNTPLTQQERAALDVVRQHYVQTGNPIPAKEFGKKLGIQGGSRQRLIASLEAQGLVRTLRIERAGRGRPSQGLVPTDRLVPNGGTKRE